MAARAGQRLNDDEGFEEDLANFLGDTYTTDEEDALEENDDLVHIGPTGDDDASSFWKNPDMPYKYPLDHVNVENLVNMLSKIKLVWPEDLPYYDELQFTTDEERAKFPATFYKNTDKEKLVLWHADNFRRQFIHKFPNRRPPVIAPKNECGCQKLFPTYINPTALGYPEFLEAVTTVEFFKDFFKPDLLNPPTKFPDRVRSHVTVIKRRVANAFEVATIAVSVLIGSGYDAYVVDGFASKTLCTMDTTEDYHEPEEKPILPYEIPEEKVVEEKNVFDQSIDYSFLGLEREEENQVVVVSPSKYRFKKKTISAMDTGAGPGDLVEGGISAVAMDLEVPEPNLSLRSVEGDDIGHEGEDEDEEEEEEAEIEEEEEAAEEEGSEEEESEIDEELPAHAKDRYHGKRTHAWILVLAGERDVEENFFLEPFSGTWRPIKDPNFLSVEAVFNHKNYWINIQQPVRNLRKLNWDLDNPAAWSKLLVEPESKRKKKRESSDQPKGIFGDDDDEDTGPGELFLTMPCSWTTDLDISQEEYDMKFPDGTKTIEYNDAIVELAAPYTNPDGLVRKVLKFTGTSRDPEDLEYIEEQFEHRKDKLSKRKWFREGKMLHEYFLPGRKDALKEHVHVSGRNKPDYPRDLYYYSNAHPRNISHRRIIKKGMIEHFEDRDDLLYYKITLFGGILCNTIPTKEDEQRSKARQIIELVKGGMGGGGGKKRARRKIVKIVEKYHRNDQKSPTEDIAEKHMLVDEGRLRILFHYVPGHFTRNTLEFFKNVRSGQSKYAPVEFKPEDCIEYQSDMTVEPMDVYKKFLLLQQMDRDERSSSVLSREAEDEVYSTVTSRVQEDWRHEIEPDAFAGDRNEEYLKMMRETNAAEDNEEELDLSGTDFTTPFFEKYGVPRNKREEILMKKRIMLHEKVKILRRAYMIKELYEKESSTLREKQDWYLRHIDQMNPSQEEDFNHMYKARLFQMHILEQRMVRHQQETPRQYYNLLVQLLRHPQLNRFTNKKVPPPPPPLRELTEDEKARIAKELAKLKDCCQFYSFRFVDQKKKQKSIAPDPAVLQQHLEAEANIEDSLAPSTAPEGGSPSGPATAEINTVSPPKSEGSAAAAPPPKQGKTVQKPPEPTDLGECWDL